MEIDQEDAGKSSPGEDRCAPFLSIQEESRECVSHKTSPFHMEKQARLLFDSINFGFPDL
jgi:hypothetical protein